MSSLLTVSDLVQLRTKGIDPATAEQQLSRLREGRVYSHLDRPCSAGDGIIRIEPESHAALERAFAAAVAAGRLTRFVPASGAASRMFNKIAPGSGSEQDRTRLLDNIEHFAFCGDLAAAMAEHELDFATIVRSGDADQLVHFLLQPDGLGYAGLPKGLLAFHAAADGARSPFIEHLAELALLLGPGQLAKAHFTVSPEHEPLFAAQLASWQGTLETTYGCHFEVDYSVQQGSTDTLALGSDGQPLRDPDGALITRPGGHGALLRNLDALHGDIVLVRNIDNVVPDSRKDVNLTWSRLLTGLLLELQTELHALVKALNEQPEEPIVRELALSFLLERLQDDVPLDASTGVLLERLDRPIRVCGMVANSGEPGGGPFWVHGSDGRMTRQIVERAQIDSDDSTQQAALAASTHFNPVDMVCGVSDWRGHPYELSHFVDDDAVIVTSKVQNGAEVRVLELPGLWNGGMAGWHTLFVEIAPEAFNPVKTLFDLLRPAHQT
jgi:hypothetical protein